MKNYTLHVKGTHCASCKILLEDIISSEDFVKKIFVNLKKEIILIDIDKDITGEELAEILTEKVKHHGYSFSVDKNKSEKMFDKNILIAIPIGIIFLMLFFILQKSGILNIGIGGEVTPITSFLIGIIASLSSCLAIVGGLVLSLSAKITQDGTTKKPFILFHIGRLISFAILGGILGLIGEVLGINFIFSTVLGIIASVVMMLLGMNLIGIFKKNKITLPSNIFKFFRKVEHATWTPILFGIGTFFLPCGFTQSMQISALSSGSFISGLVIMLSFALGTLPVLVLLSFGSVSFAHSKYASLFFKSAGVIVIGLGIFALISGLVGVGLINPLFNL